MNKQITTICQPENNELIWRNTTGKIKKTTNKEQEGNF